MAATGGTGAADVASDVLLDVRMVSKRFGGVRAVEDVSIAVRRGAIASIIGPNGAGKTSLLNMISGFYRPDGGSITFEGTDTTRFRPAEIAALDRDRHVLDRAHAPEPLRYAADIEQHVARR